MHYQPGDYVYPTDLPRRFPCCVEHVELQAIPSGSTQILHLVPLAGPWPQGTVLIRLCEAVARIEPSELWQISSTITCARA
jgi:hypothetical protein